MKPQNNQKIKHIIDSKTEIVIEKDSIEKKLKSGKVLRVKLGADPSSPDLHLGHFVVLKKLKEFQDLGHEIIFIIGDYTARIGDPSGKSKTRPPLSGDEIKKNAKTYFKQVGKILDIKKLKIKYNSQWFDGMNFGDVLNLLGKATINQILEREDFNKRFKARQPIGLHELIYPLMQAYDSVYLKSDIEIGGSDQLFNLLMGRTLQEKLGQVPQDIITCPLLIGLDGAQKMSKSLKNYIALTDLPDEMFGKLMSIPDTLIINYFKLLSDLSEEKIIDIEDKMKKGDNPRDFKVMLSKLIVSEIYDNEKAEMAAKEFDRIFKAKQIPDKIPEVKIKIGEYNILDILNEIKITSSKSEAKRLVEQGGIKINEEKISDWKYKLRISGMPVIIQSGKRKFIKILSR